MKNLTRKRSLLGVTLIEILFVLAIMAMIIFMIVGYLQQQAFQTRIDRTAQQMQQILNAGLAYYVSYGAWPGNSGPGTTSGDTSINCLLGEKGCSTAFLTNIGNSPWGQLYQMSWYSTTAPNSCPATSPNASSCGLFYVFTEIAAGASSQAIALAIAGKLPMAYTSGATPSGGQPPANTSPCTADGPCYIVSSVNIPGQNLNNATAVNFAGLYHHGACVPVPQCPVGSKPNIMVVPTSVSGVNNPSGTTPNVFPLESFTAYATDAATLPTLPPNCTGTTPSTPATCGGNTATATSTNQFWRVCLSVTTSQGVVSSDPKAFPAQPAWGQFVWLMAITRCAAPGEPSGSPTSIYTN